LWENENIPSHFPTLEYLGVSAAKPLFVHRINADGTIDSFCRKCFITVASSHWEAELERAEHKHECDKLQLAYVQSVLSPLQ
jgi:hypothetical protein